MAKKESVLCVFAFKSQKEFRDSTWANAAINVSSDPKGGGGVLNTKPLQSPPETISMEISFNPSFGYTLRSWAS